MRRSLDDHRLKLLLAVMALETIAVIIELDTSMLFLLDQALRRRERVPRTIAVPFFDYKYQSGEGGFYDSFRMHQRDFDDLMTAILSSPMASSLINWGKRPHLEVISKRTWVAAALYQIMHASTDR